MTRPSSLVGLRPPPSLSARRLALHPRWDASFSATLGTFVVMLVTLGSKISPNLVTLGTYAATLSNSP
jgi:hypothetical protein